MYVRVVATTPSKPAAFASTVTRSQTSMDDVNGVWQKDRGGKFNNYLNVDLEIQDDSGNLIPLDYRVPVEAELVLVMEDGTIGGVLDRVTRSSRRIMNKHLEGEHGKLMIIDADPSTGGGICVGGTSKTTIKTRINELSKKGSRNSRFSVIYRPAGPGSENFIVDPRKASSKPLTIYSKVVKAAKDDSMSNHVEQAKIAAQTLLSEVEKVDPSKASPSSKEAAALMEILEACRIIQKKLEWQTSLNQKSTNSGFSPHALSIFENVFFNSGTSSSNNISFHGDSQLLSANDSTEWNKRMKPGTFEPHASAGKVNIVGGPAFESEDGDFSLEALENFVRDLDSVKTQVNVTNSGLSISLFDENDDGEIDRDEMARGIARLDIPLTAEMQKRIFDEFDTNKDGVITVQEFIQGVKKREAELIPLFEQLDKNNDGYLTFEELRSSALLNNVASESISELISFIDSLSQEEPDGRISLREFLSTFTMLPSGDSLESFANMVSLHRRNSMQ